ncbi:MAG: hypothetical protein ABJG41_10050 [Cyclobacteriaceae bacterium]
MTARAKFVVDIPDKDLQRMVSYIEKTAKAAGLAQEEIDDMMDELQSGSKNGSGEVEKLNKKFNGFGDTVKKVGGFMAAAFAVDRLLDYQKQIIAIVSEYQKFAAVLETALGSRSAAVTAMAQIQNFAKKTPFQVNQLTDSYVKLVNRGLQPANKELTAMGDFTAAVGKDMNQLVEAILDVSNTERWTELGVKVRSSGDKIIGTFKGITIEEDRTERGALRMIQAFGEMEGVAGSMSAISETLGGKISNLDDAFDRLFKTIGDQESGPMTTVTTWLTDLVNIISDGIESDIQETNRAVADLFDSMRQELSETLKTAEDYESKISDLEGTYSSLRDEWKNSADQSEDLKVEINATKLIIELLKKELKQLNDETVKGYGTWDDYLIVIEDVELQALKLANSLNKSFSDAGKAIEGATSWIDEMEKFIDEGTAEIIEADAEIIDANEKVVDGYKKNLDDIRKAHEETKAYMKDGFYHDMGSYATDYFNNIVAMQVNAGDRQIQALERQREYELKLAGENTDEQTRINEEFDSKIAQIRRRQAKRERNAALFEIAVQTASNAVKLFAATIPPGLLSAAAILVGATQAGVVASTPEPAFFKGVVGFKGKGTDTSDENRVRISNNESIITALGTRKFRPYLEAFNDPNFTEKDLHNMVLKELPAGVSMQHGNLGGSGVKEQVIREMVKQMSGEITSAIHDKKAVNIFLDGHKHTAEVIDGVNAQKYLAKKFGISI